MRIYLLIIIFFSVTFSYAVREYSPLVITNIDNHEIINFKKKKHKKRHFVKIYRKSSPQKKLNLSSVLFKTKGRTKGKAILMAILAGPLGGHRLYLGTKPYVPIIYAITLGGGLGLLPAIDIIVILTTKDLSKYYDNPQIIMW